jgi:pyruvate,water dikinase
MDIEWAKDGLNNQLYIVQADQKRFMEKTKKQVREIYKLKDSLSPKESHCDKSPRKARILHNPQEEINCWKAKFSSQTYNKSRLGPQKKQLLITNKGGRTSHAAIVARELGTAVAVDVETHRQLSKHSKSPYPVPKAKMEM